jgi:dUTP pyrophosphatase
MPIPRAAILPVVYSEPYTLLGLPPLHYAKDGDAGFDLHACVDYSITIEPFGRRLIPTGISVAVPEGMELQVRPRSGLAIKHGVTVLNAPGTVDSGFRGELGVILCVLDREPFQVNPGDRIAQAVLAPFVEAHFRGVDVLDQTARGADGFGSTGR